MSSFGEKICESRHKCGLTQDQLAERLGVSAQAVSKWERGESMPDSVLLPIIAKELGVSIDSLFDIEKEPIVEYQPEKRDFNKTVLRIHVDDDGERINVNLPLVLIKTIVEVGLPFESDVTFGGANLSALDWPAIINMVESGVIGTLVTIDGDDGTHLVVEVV